MPKMFGSNNDIGLHIKANNFLVQQRLINITTQFYVLQIF